MDTDGDRLVFYRRAGKEFARSAVNAFARRLRAQVTPGRSFTCLVSDDRELRRLNRDFLGNDYPTDVLSFPISDEVPTQQPPPDEAVAGDSPVELLGEIAISADRAREQARALGHSVEDEIGILMLHGLLHLLGLDHETDRGQMARAERQWRHRLSLPDSLIERTNSKQ